MPWFRICGDAAVLADNARAGNRAWMSGWLTTSISRAIAPISIPPAVDRISRIDSMPPRSTTTRGRFTRSLNQSSVSSPPAYTQASDPCSASSASASSALFG